jgi:hypothetical protein
MFAEKNEQFHLFIIILFLKKIPRKFNNPLCHSYTMVSCNKLFFLLNYFC